MGALAEKTLDGIRADVATTLQVRFETNNYKNHLDHILH